MDGEMGQTLGVRAAARRLGVHENTLRNWVREGLLSDARVPGSRYLRVPEADVERLLRQRGAAAPTLETERQLARAELLDAAQLAAWPNERQRDAQQRFPELVQRLLVETPDCVEVRVVSGDGISEPGYDGVVTVLRTTPVLPAGRLVLEMGVTKQVASKASDDYEKRISKASHDEVFVFLTPRRWTGGRAWADERRAEGHFADVRVIDAPMLEGWLRDCPSTHYWISEHLGFRPTEAKALDHWWDQFSASTSPALPIGLFTAGRDSQAVDLVARLEAPAAPSPNPFASVGGLEMAVGSRVTVETEWVKDGYAFVHAALRTGGGVEADHGGRLDPLPVPLLVSSSHAWDRLVQRRGRSILMPTFVDADVDGAISNGHSVVIVLDRSHPRSREVDIALPRVARSEAAAAFAAAGPDFGKADRLAALARRSLPALTRKLSRDPRLQPEWIVGETARVLAPMALVNTWTESAGDQVALEHLTGTSWHQLEVYLNDVSRSEDPMCRRTNGHWRLAAPDEGLLSTMDYLTSSTLDRWADLIETVLLEANPLQSMTSTEKLMAQLKEVSRKHSEPLRSGLADGLALAGSLSSLRSMYRVAADIAETAERTVERLLRRANADASGSTWIRLAPYLPRIAEAAPEQFLGALVDDLDGNEPCVRTLFAPPSEDLLGSFAESVHLLWALETLCWSPAYIVDASRLLARLVEVADGAVESPEVSRRSGNHPLRSLVTVLSGWVANTSSSVEDKLRALDAVGSVSSDLGWKLLMALWPTHHATSSPPAEPHFQDWLPATSTVSLSAWSLFVDGLVTRAVIQAGSNATRLASLVEKAAPLRPEHRATILDLVHSVAIGGLTNDDRLTLWESIAQVAATHGRFPDADWSMAQPDLDRLTELTELLRPEDDPRRYARLFSRGYEPDAAATAHGDFRSRRNSIDAQRSSAIDEILGRPDATEVLETMARRVDAPNLIGWYLAIATNPDVDLMLRWVTSEPSELVTAGLTFLSRWLGINAEDVLEPLLDSDDLPLKAREAIITSIPANPRFWRILDGHPDDAHTYWTTARIEAVDPEHVGVAVDRLVQHQRAWAAIALCSDILHLTDNTAEEHLSVDAITALLESAARGNEADPNDLSSSTAYNVGHLLDYLSEHDAPQTELARFEFLFLRLLEHTRQPSAMNSVLNEEPDTFVDLVQMAYRARNDAPGNDADHIATQAWMMLREWNGYPGRRTDGTLDAHHLREWVTVARLALSDSGHADIGDELIGQSFTHAAKADDDIWPPTAMRDLIEDLGSRQLENGVILGRLNSRGITVRDPYEGGEQERGLSATYREWSREAAARWPRTSRILRDIAKSYDRDAKQMDTRAELRSDRD